ncbi:MAG TPA: HEAT repeat domain-containing protein [Candidatus Nitrosopolaris sp.]|nr:HEAT repeat domain-containing protein [Candidatus Nitrosopolaris sp.]
MVASAPGVIERTRIGVRRAAARRQLQAVVEGRSGTVEVDVADTSLDLATLIKKLIAGPRQASLSRWRLLTAFERSGAANKVVDQFAATSADKRLQSARIAGALAMEQTVTLLAPLLSAREPELRQAAARALGKIGGTRSAEALLRALRRRGASRTLIVELARAAPDLFLEVELCAPQRFGVKPAIAAAAGLRRRNAAVTPLLALLSEGSRRERAACCRALGWIGARSSAPALADSLRDPDWRVRISAAKSLARLGQDSYMAEIEALAFDMDPRVRRVALDVYRQLFTSTSRRAWGWQWL